MFSFEQTRELRRKREPQVLSDVVVCLFVLNRRAKRCRDQAQRYYGKRMHGFAGARRTEKAKIYALKDQALAHLIAEGALRETNSYHKFPDGNIAQVVTDGRFRFHRPVADAPAGAEFCELSIVEAKAKGFTEPPIADALATISAYTSGKPALPVFRWPDKVAARKVEPEAAQDDSSGSDDSEEDPWE